MQDTFRFYLSKTPVLSAELDGRSSFIANRAVTIDGIRAGYEYEATLKFYVGMYWNRNKIVYDVDLNPGTLQHKTVTQQARFFYLATTCEYTFFKHYPWFLTVPVQAGIGWGTINQFEKTGLKITNEVYTFVPVESMFKAKYHVLRWLSLNACLGVRYALFSRTVSKDFTAPVYSYGVSILPMALYNTLKEKKLIK